MENRENNTCDFFGTPAGHIVWRGRRFCLIDIRAATLSNTDFDLTFYDGLLGGEVAYIRQNESFGFDCYLTAPNTEMFTLGSITEIYSEIPKIVNS